MTTHHRRIPLGEHGFTLVEMMIALLIFGVGVVTLAQALPQGMQMRDRARRMTVATSLAQEQLEQLRSLPRDDADLAAGNHADPDNPIEGAYNRTWVVLDDTPLPGMKRVDVTVTFVTAGQDNQSVLSTQLTR